MKLSNELTGSAENQEEYGFNLLIEEPPLQVLPSLAEAIGLEAAIIVQQLHYFERRGFGRKVNGVNWIFNTYEEWRKIFPFWSERTIRRMFVDLEKTGLVESCQPEGRMSRRKYYRLNRGVVNLLRKGKVQVPCGQTDRIVSPNWPLPITETTCIESKESKETVSGETASFSAQWKPLQGTKEQKLQRIKPPRDYPTERDFDTFLEQEGLDSITTYRDTLYSDLCDSKWHQWKGDAEKWVRIRDWKAYVRKLDTKIQRF